MKNNSTTFSGDVLEAAILSKIKKYNLIIQLPKIRVFGLKKKLIIFSNLNPSNNPTHPPTSATKVPMS